MNANQSSTFRQAWRKFYRISRLGKASPRNLVTLLSGDCAQIYIAALQAAAERDSYHTALMSRRITSVDSARWLVSVRCGRYVSHAGRLPA